MLSAIFLLCNFCKQWLRYTNFEHSYLSCFPCNIMEWVDRPGLVLCKIESSTSTRRPPPPHPKGRGPMIGYALNAKFPSFVRSLRSLFFLKQFLIRKRSKHAQNTKTLY